MQSSKFVVQDIVIPEQEIQELKSKLKHHTNRSLIIRKHCGRTCSLCASIPSKKVSYDVGDGKLVDFYCDLCFQKHKSDLDKRLQNMNLEIKFQH